MTAAELFEVVKDVPREAWPIWAFPGLTFGMNDIVAWPPHIKMCDEVAEHAFIGSMTVWLAFHNWFPKSHIWRDGARVMLVDGTTHKAPSLVAALAAACKEAA